MVADFGLARLVTKERNQGRTSSLERPGKGSLSELRRPDRKKRYTVVGNPYWMAPEMIHGEGLTLRASIYSMRQYITGKAIYISLSMLCQEKAMMSGWTSFPLVS